MKAAEASASPGLNTNSVIFQSWLHVCHFTSLSFRLLLCKVGPVLGPTWQGGRESLAEEENQGHVACVQLVVAIDLPVRAVSGPLCSSHTFRIDLPGTRRLPVAVQNGGRQLCRSATMIWR